MTQQNTLRGKKFEGDIYLRKYGTTDGFVKAGNITELSTSQEVEKDELIGTGLDNYGQAIESEITPQPTEISLKFNSFDKHSFARALNGVAVDITGSVTEIADTELTAQLGVWLKLSHNDIDPEHFELKNKGKQVIDKKHYQLNTRLGMVLLLDTAGVADKDVLTYKGKTKGTSGFSVDANSLTKMEFELMLDGRDRITGKFGQLHIPHVVLSADGDLNWFSDEWWEAGLNGTVIKDDGKPSMRFTELG